MIYYWLEVIIPINLTGKTENMPWELFQMIRFYCLILPFKPGVGWKLFHWNTRYILIFTTWNAQLCKISLLKCEFWYCGFQQPWFWYLSYRFVVVLAFLNQEMSDYFIFDFSQNSWTHKHDFPTPNTHLLKYFLIKIHHQLHLFWVTANHTNSFLFNFANMSWVENEISVLDHEYLLDAEQLSVFLLSK